MERRSFLTGTLASVVAGTALVKLATPAETQALIVAEPVLIGQPRYQIPHIGVFDGIVYLRSTEQRGAEAFVPIGQLTEINVSTARMDFDVTTWDGTATFMPGLTRATIRFEGSSL